MMKLFASWSGDRGRAVASALQPFLNDVFQNVRVWVSEHDIKAGAQWGLELRQALADCKAGIICITPESLQSRWLLFESGALSTAGVGSKVIPYRFGVRGPEIGPPLSQFQAVDANKGGTYKLVESVNSVTAKRARDDLKRTFENSGWTFRSLLKQSRACRQGRFEPTASFWRKS